MPRARRNRRGRRERTTCAGEHISHPVPASASFRALRSQHPVSADGLFCIACRLPFCSSFDTASTVRATVAGNSVPRCSAALRRGPRDVRQSMPDGSGVGREADDKRYTGTRDHKYSRQGARATGTGEPQPDTVLRVSTARDERTRRSLKTVRMRSYRRGAAPFNSAPARWPRCPSARGTWRNIDNVRSRTLARCHSSPQSLP